MRLGRAVAVVAGFLLLLPTVAFAQVTLAGTVKDASGAVLPGVTIEASSPVLHRKNPDGDERYRRAVSHRKPAAGHVRGDLQAGRLRDLEA